MPCDSVILNEVDMPKMHPTLTGHALNMFGATGIVLTDGRVSQFSYQGSKYAMRDGTLVGLDGQSAIRVGEVADLLKCGYSHQVVQMTAQRNGWTLRATGPHSYAVLKR